MTADSLPPRMAEARRDEPTPKPAADLQLISDLIADARRRAAVLDEDPLRTQLEAVERVFGRQIFDERARSAVEAARERALRIADAAGGLSETITLTFAGDLFLALGVERPWRARDVGDLVPGLARLLHTKPKSVATQLLLAALRAPQLLELPPPVALDVQLSMLVALSPAIEASVWVKDASGRPECLVSVGKTATTRRFRTIALRLLEGKAADDGERGLIVGAPVRRWQTSWGALVARVKSRESSDALLEEAADAIAVIAERDFLIQRSGAREHSLVSASERRLARLGFDLHDGALQHIAALSADLRKLRSEVGPCTESLEDRVVELDRVLRELAHSLEPASLLRRPLQAVVETEAATLSERTGINTRTRVTGDFGAMTPSQKIALIRVLQEGFTNIREHSNATSVDVVLTASRSCVELHIQDDGDGFEVTRTLLRAAQRGRLGIVGSSERVRLLGGTFDITSRPGGPTRVSLSLPRWQPLAVEQAADFAAAPAGFVD
jgi:signal transduction histidine kinase